MKKAYWGNNPLKILLTHEVMPDKQNGVSISMGILSRELKKLGHDIRILTLSDNTKTYKKGNIYCLSSVPAFIYPGIRTRFRKNNKFVKELVEWEPDIIHTNSEFMTFKTAKLIYKKCKNKPVWIHTLHTDYQYYIGPLGKIPAMRYKFVPWYLNRCMIFSDALIVPTKKTYNYIENGKFAEKIKKNMVIIPTGIDFGELGNENAASPAQTKKELGIPEDAKVVIFLGRVSSEKNLGELLSCFEEYVKTHENTYMLVVGDGPYKETLKKTVQKAGIKDRVIVHDGVPHTQIRKYYDAADVFASASESETQGLTFYEAMYCNLPVLAKDRACLEDAVTEGENGAFFDGIQNFSEALDSIIDAKKQNKNTLPECFESETFAKAVVNLYEEMLEKKNKK